MATDHPTPPGLTPDAAAIVQRLALIPHPEGGYYRETLRQPAPGGGRPVMTAILFLLDRADRSHWHRIDASEIWVWHAGSPVDLSIADGAIAHYRLGGDVLGGDTQQALVPPGAWQSAKASDGWALMSCIVAPGFDFAFFELAPAGWHPATAGDDPAM